MSEMKHTNFEPAELSSGEREIDGQPWMVMADGSMQPKANCKAQDLLQDELTRKVMGYAIALSDQVARFKGHTFEDIGAFDALLAQEYGATLGGRKGNKTLQTLDGLNKIEVRVADLLDFGPELQIAKTLIDECLNEWSAGARPEIQAIVTRAFNTDKAGQINRSEIFMLLRLEIDDERWRRAMDAIRDAIRVVGSKTYYRFSRRKARDGLWSTVTIDLAKA